MKTPIYLDNNASTPIDPRVLEAMLPALEKDFGNSQSSTHSYGWYAAELVKIAREEVAKFINASPEEIYFTSGATESNNAVIQGLSKASYRKEKSFSAHFITQCTEHKSVLAPLNELKEFGHKVSVLGVDQEGFVSLEDYQKSLQEDTLLVSFMLGNNEIGTINDIKAFSQAAVKSGALFHCDAAQAAAKLKLDVADLGVDYLTLSAHKMYGPKGIGALYIKNKTPATPIDPLILGAGHENGLRSGTLNVPAIVGFGKACEVARTSLDAHKEHLNSLTKRFLDKLNSELPNVTLNGSSSKRLPGNLSLAFDGINSATLVTEIGSKIAFSVGSACTSKSTHVSHVLKGLRVPGDVWSSTIRIGIGRFNTAEEIDLAANILISAVKKLK